MLRYLLRLFQSSFSRQVGLSKYFSDDELRCKQVSKKGRCKCGGIVKIDPRFKKALLDFRIKWNKPMTVNSSCRCEEHNKNIGGASRSYHLFEGVNDGREGTLAIDISVSNGQKRKNMIDLAWSLGWSIGEYKTFIHMDRRVDVGVKQIKFKGKY